MISGLGTKTLHATLCGQKFKKIKKKMDRVIIKWTLDPQTVPFSIMPQELSFYVNCILAF